MKCSRRQRKIIKVNIDNSQSRKRSNAALHEKSFLHTLMLYIVGKTKGPEQATSIMNGSGSSGVSKGPRGHHKLTPLRGTEERTRQSR